MHALTLLMVLALPLKTWAYGAVDCYRNIAPGTYISKVVTYASGPSVVIVFEEKCVAPPGYEDYVCGSCNADGSAQIPNVPAKAPPRCPATTAGSIIETESFNLREVIPISGSSGSLNYSAKTATNRAADRSFTVSLSGSTLDPDATGFRVQVDVAGQTQTQSFGAQPNLQPTFTWDGKDDAGNVLAGAAVAKVTVFSLYNVSGMPDTGIPYTQMLGSYNARQLGLGGLTLSKVHFYDPVANRFYSGDGSVQDVAAMKVILDAFGNVTAGSDSAFTHLLVADESLPQAYLFLPDGRHVQTRSTVSGALLSAITYDAQGGLTNVTDAFGRQTTVNRAMTNQIVITTPDGQSTTLSLDAQGRAITVQDALGRTHQLSYDSAGLLAMFGRPNGSSSTFTYDSNGLLTLDSHSSGAFVRLWQTIQAPTQRYSYSETASGLQTYTFANNQDTNYNRSTQYPDGTYSSYAHYSYYTQVTGRDGANSTYYPLADSRFAGQVTAYSETQNDANSYLNITRTKSSTPTSGNILKLNSDTTTTQIGSNSWITSFDPQTLTKTTTSPLGRITSIQSNEVDQVTSVSSSGIAPATYAYDTAGRLSRISQAARQTTLAYDSSGYLASVTNPLNQTIHFTSNANGQVLTQTMPDNRVIAYSYDQAGNLASLTTASSKVHSFLSNAYDLVMTYLAPPLGETAYETQYSYGTDRRLSRITRADGSTFDFTYGSGYQFTNNIATPDGIYSYTYQGGKLSSAQSPSGVTTQYGYSGSYVTSTNTSWSGVSMSVSHSYTDMLLTNTTLTDTAGNSSQVVYTYDNDRLLTGVGDMTITRDPSSGRVTSTTLGGMQETYSYDSTYGELSSYIAAYNGTQKYKEEYERDGLGRIITKLVTDAGVTTTNEYGYDYVGRLKDVYINGTLKRSYGYDANSNRTSFTEDGVTITATYDDQDRLLTYGPYSYSYNMRGEFIGRTKAASAEAFTYNYDLSGAFKTVTYTYESAGQTQTDTFTYLNDANGHTLEKQRNGVLLQRYIYDERGRLLASIDSGGAVSARYIYGESSTPEYQVRAGVVLKSIRNNVGTPVKWLDVDGGTTVEALRTDEFGESISAGSTSLGFAGGINDDHAGVLRFGARYYDPKIGRWLTRDPILFGGGDINLYAYVMNDPVNFIDPSGLFLTGPQWVGMIGGAAAGGIAGAYYGTYVSPGFGTGFGAVAGGFFGAALGGSILAPQAGASPIGPPRSEPSLLPPLFQQQPSGDDLRCN